MTQTAALPNAEQLSGSGTKSRARSGKSGGQLSENDLERFKGNVDQLVGYVQQKTGQARQEIEAFLAQAATNASGLAQRVRDTATEFTSRAAETVQEQYGQVSEKVGETYAEAQDMVRRNPAGIDGDSIWRWCIVRRTADHRDAIAGEGPAEGGRTSAAIRAADEVLRPTNELSIFPNKRQGIDRWTGTLRSRPACTGVRKLYRAATAET